MARHGRVLMSETDQFWEYAKEAMLLVCDAKTAKDKQEFLSFPGPGRKQHYRVDLDRLATSVPRKRLKQRSLGQAHRPFF